MIHLTRCCALFVLLLAVAAAGCGPEAEPGGGDRYDLTGVIVSVDQRANQVIVEHEAIPDFMEAMTMPFTVGSRDRWALDKMQPGDRLHATLVVNGDRSWLEDVVFVHEEPNPNAGPAGGVGPKPGDAVPDFALVNQDGRRIGLGQFKGRALALTFIYTRCPLPDYCPLMTSNFQEVEKALREDPELYRRTALLSVTVDPDYDKPAVLREYGAAHTSDFGHWQFATGDKEEIRKLAGFFGLQYFEEGGQIIHSLATAVVTPDGRLAKFYRGNEWKAGEIVADLRAAQQP